MSQGQQPGPQPPVRVPPIDYDKGDWADDEWGHVTPEILSADEAAVVETLRQRGAATSPYGHGKQG
jgi:hypothetical protein